MARTSGLPQGFAIRYEDLHGRGSADKLLVGIPFLRAISSTGREQTLKHQESNVWRVGGFCKWDAIMLQTAPPLPPPNQANSWSGRVARTGPGRGAFRRDWPA